jgi:enoyl-CoA hydratase
MPISVDKSGSIALVTVDFPPVNALTFAAYDQITEIFSQLSQDTSTSVVILTGAGERAFVAGHDVREFVGLTPDLADTELLRVRRAFDAVQDCAAPVIAAVNGAAVGAGLALASLCDIRVASSRAVFALPEIDVGVLGSGSHLMRIAPHGLTRLMVLTGRRLSAADAWRAGIIEELVEPDELLDAAWRLAHELAAKSPLALRLAKQSLDRVAELSVRDGYEYECSLTSAIRHDHNAAEAARSFVEKRSPQFD